MTTEQKKETISNSIIRLLANLHGFKISIPEQDHGVDMVVTRVRTYPFQGGIRYTDSHEVIHLQLKCTTEQNIILTKENLKFDLKSKNYNDLIFRRTSEQNLPLVLILIVLPSNMQEWISVEQLSMTINNHAYWYYPSKDLTLSKNKQKVRISIPKKNQIITNFFPKLFDNFFEKKIL